MVDKRKFGEHEGKEVFLYTLKNPFIEVSITNFGGIITSLLVPDREGRIGDIVLGFDDLSSYQKEHPYFGALIGRFANRIAHGKFTLEGKTYELAKNFGNHHLHGGKRGFDKVVWQAVESEGKLILNYKSVNGEEGYPGNLDVSVNYLIKGRDLSIVYEAVSDRPTPLNLTNHSYFNLSAGASTTILAHELQLTSDKITEVDDELIPTGRLISVPPYMDFRDRKPIGQDIEQVQGGYDHNYLVTDYDGSLKMIAYVYEPISGRRMSVLTTQPGVQFYSGNFLDGSLSGKRNVNYQKYAGFCLETQHFPDSPNHPGFPDTILKPGQRFHQETIYRFE